MILILMVIKILIFYEIQGAELNSESLRILKTDSYNKQNSSFYRCYIKA